MKKSLLWVALFCGSIAPYALAEEMVEVALFCKDRPREVELSARQGLVVRDAQHQILLSGTDNIPLVFSVHKNQVRISGLHNTGETYSNLTIRPAHDREFLYAGHGKPSRTWRPYAGEILVYAEKKSLQLVNRLAWPDYIAAVVSQEMPVSWHAEALKAQAVVSRTYAVRNINRRHAGERFSFCDLTHCQVYQGTRKISPEIQAAVRQTRGQILTFNNEPIDAVYHSCCGGQTTAVWEVWPGSELSPCLAGIMDQGAQGAFCRAAPESEWRMIIQQADIKKIIAGKWGRTGQVMEIGVVSRHQSGRVDRMIIRTRRGALELSGMEFYRLWGHQLGWHQLKSTWFEVEARGKEFVFSGKGLGHGAGLCQWGAQGRALAGQNYRQILEAYFPEAEIIKWKPED